MRRFVLRAATVSLVVLGGACGAARRSAPVGSVPAGSTLVSVAVLLEDELQRLEQARQDWAASEIDSYRLVVSERANFWAAGCTWATEIVDATVVDASVESTQPDRVGCRPIDWTVEMLHDHVGEWIELARGQTPDREPNWDLLTVTFDTHGVPVAARFDAAQIVDEEIDRIVTFTPIQ